MICSLLGYVSQRHQQQFPLPALKQKWITSAGSLVLLRSTSEAETHAYKGMQQENHSAMTCKRMLCLFLPEQLILYCNNSVMVETWHRMANSMPSILLGTIAFTLYQLFKLLLEVTYLPQTKLLVGLCKCESCLERRMWIGKGVVWRKGQKRNTSEESIKGMLHAGDYPQTLLTALTGTSRSPAIHEDVLKTRPVCVEH